MKTRNCRWCGWCIRGWKNLKAHVRSSHRPEWLAMQVQLTETDTKLESLELAASTLSHGWDVFEPKETYGAYRSQAPLP